MHSNIACSLLLIAGSETESIQVSTLLKQLSGKEYRMHWVHTLKDAEALILESEPQAFDLCLVDDETCDGDGIEFIAAHSADIEFPPLVLLTTPAHADLDQAALNAGAMDYLHKPELTPALLERSIRYSISQHAANRQLVKLATTDPLTGVLNRRTLYDLGDKEFDRATRYRYPLSLMLIAVDHFKTVNDTFGTQVGDQVLKLVVQSVIEAIRETDILGRFSGNEFLLILPHTDANGATQLAERCKETIKSQPMAHCDAVINISVSYGVCSLSEEIEFFDELIVCADRSLYQDAAETA